MFYYDKHRSMISERKGFVSPTHGIGVDFATKIAYIAISSSPEYSLATSVYCVIFQQERFARPCQWRTGANCICPEPSKEKQHFQILGTSSMHGAIHYKAALCTAALGYMNKVCHGLYIFQGCAAKCRELWWAIDNRSASFTSRLPMPEDKKGSSCCLH
jgi:hypothetical protein